MSRGSQENERVRRQIISALFELMKEKPSSAITVSEIIRRAGVARASYYRNFTSKEDIICSAMDNIKVQVLPSDDTHSSEDFFRYDIAVHGFEAALSQFLLNKSDVLALYDNGYASLLQGLINEYIEEVVGDMKQASSERYLLYYISGATFNVLIQWLKGGAMESPHEMAKLCADIMCKPVLRR